jgi:hypothetical protein
MLPPFQSPPFQSLYLDRRLVRSSHTRWVGLHWLLAGATLALVAATWRLWTPQQVFPQVPLLAIGLWIPVWLGWAATGVLVASPWLAALFEQRETVRRSALAAFVVALVLLFIANQHRLQPWAYQFAIIAAVLALATTGRALGLCRLLTVGIYFHSAWTKLDYSFLHDLGPRLIQPLGLPESCELVAAAALPLGEILIAFGLLLPVTRKTALIASIVMHVALLLILGPLGLDHSWGVLLWNVFFIFQGLLLFCPTNHCRRRIPSPINTGRILLPTTTRSATSQRIATTLVAAALVLPFAEPWGVWDMWPSWGLYASKAERTVVLLRTTNDSQLPRELREYLIDLPDGSGWLQLDLQTWSLSTLGVPLYPQNRFQLAVASRVAAVLENRPLENKAGNVGIRVLLVSQSHWRTGQRQTTELANRPQIDDQRTKFLLSAKPAKNWNPSH